MSLPEAWRPTGCQTESGQAWLHQVTRRDGDVELYALKILKNPNRAKRFAREVRTMIRLRSEKAAAVPEIVESNLEAERPWFVMPWCRRGSLQEAVDDQRYRGDTSAGIRLLVRLAEALGDVHAAGVAHRDLKPANVLLGEHGPLLTDFGLCFEVDDPDARLTGSDEAVGSWLYIAPENEGGFNQDADQRPADFYAFGKTIWAVLAGQRPLARELITERRNRLVNVLEEANLSSLDVLIRDLTNRDPRVRLKDWEVVIRELTSMSRVLTGDRESVPEPLGGDPAMLAQRLRSSQLVAQGIDAAGQEERRIAWFRQLARVLQEEGRKGARAVERLDDELGDVLDVGVVSGSPPEASALVLAGLDLHVRPIPIEATQVATVFLIHSRQGWESLPTLALRVSPVLTDDGLRMVRVPLLTESGLPERPPSFLVPRLATMAGPFPELRHSTIEACRQVVQDSARLFVPLAEAYVELVGRERSPADPDAWADIDLEPVALTEAAGDRGDTQPPELRSLEIFPPVSARSGGLDVQVRARIVDKPAGIAREGFTSSPCQARFRSRAGQFSDAMFGTAERMSGDEFDGIYQTTVHFDEHAERGGWTLEYVLLVDQAGNSRTYTTAELNSVGFPSRIDLK